MQLSNLPFVLHVIIETAAAASFIFKPASQLPNPSVAARLVLESFGGLLLTTNLICLIFVSRPEFDGTSRLVAISLAFWHVWPCRRAYVRLTNPAVDGKTSDQAKTLGGPAAHLAVHFALFSLFVGAAFFG
ncbi:uncharacterized protein CTRU02_210956 [Colletotrichum truncatum]|uniref:Uncharacterized protein n=1 Tax=Colletotrichum truncatum TaxID=5467 RepID=A0ACC3YSM2_COLTU|nr:uncharacterized protein CTRU02_03562 [Colletotrichum truncatum]KAF6796584.1 hypothetical protein CTRU02_03562 [Colletotrichum truncatum]